ncbi:MAG: tRNA 2-thiouridine(34) synthase MnmA [Gammaproteobacteria bacterium]
MSNQPAKHIIVGLSGGVDSAVAALLLQQQGYRVSGLFMKNWEDDSEHCSAQQDLADAQAICTKLQIPLHTVNFSHEYWDNVFTHFLTEYKAGRTPNPDILCNKEIKFKAFLHHALKLGADYIATGHYVRLFKDKHALQLLKAKDDNKDQSYFLYTLNQEQLQYSVFPLGEYTKPQVRQLAQQHGFINYNKKDSTGICFIGERKFKTFLQEYVLTQPGPIHTVEGESIGQHDGLMFYTFGQRKGIGIGGQAHHPEDAWYVVDKDIKNNILLVAQGNHHPRLFSHKLTCQQLHWIAGNAPGETFDCFAKTRYRQPDQACSVQATAPDQLTVTFTDPQRAVTPGQSIVFYQDEICLGGGVIDTVDTAN